jgi:hypothetical protein
MASRYFATVRLATVIPLSDRVAAILLSLRGLAGFSFAISMRIFAFIDIEDSRPSPLFI